jgi:hypothetical protein
MKNIFKAFGIIAIVAVIGFSMAACSNGDDGVTPNPDNFLGCSEVSLLKEQIFELMRDFFQIKLFIFIMPTCHNTQDFDTFS